MTPGETFDTDYMTLNEAEIIEFARLWDPQSFHTSVEGGVASPFNGLIGSGLQSLCAIMRLGVLSGFLSKNCIAGMGIDRLRFIAPLRPDDRVRASFRVTTVRASNSKPNCEVISIEARLVKFDGEVLLDSMFTNLYRKADAS